MNSAICRRCPGFLRASLVLALMLTFGLPLTLQGQFSFSTNNGSLTITGYTGSASIVVIPATTNGYSVTAIGTLAFLDATFTSITIPNSISTIGDFAFYACLNVTKFDIPASVTNISPSAFNFTYAATNFNVDAANPAYSSPGGVLMDKAQKLLVQYPANLALTTYAISNTVTRIGDWAFYYCRNLQGVIIPESVTNIGMGGFLGCVFLTSVTIPDSVLTVSDSAFLSCQAMTNLVIGNHVTQIGNLAFDSCTSLAYPLVIPDSVVSLGSNAFTQCSSLPAVTIGGGVTNIGVNAFEFCSKLTGINVSTSNAVYSSAGGVLFDKAQSTLIQFPVGATATYVVPNSVTRIESHAFDGSTKLFTITFDASLTNIGDYAFNGCYNLPDVTIPNSVITLGGEAFEGCLTVHTISLGTNLISIGAGAFYGCIVMPSVIVPSNVTNIGNQAFGNCSSLTNISVDASNPAYSSSNGILFDKAMTTILQYPEGVGGAFVVPTNVHNIGDYSFATCSLTAVTIPNTVTNIGNFAFYRDGIANVLLQDSLINIGAQAFAYTSLTNLIIPNSVVRIGTDAFENCTGLTNVLVGTGVTDLGADAFYGCHALLSAYFQGNAPANNGTAFFQDSKTTVYYEPGTGGWGSTYGGVPTMLNPAAPPLLRLSATGFLSNQFAISLVGASNAVIVVQATTNLANPVWVPIATNALSSVGVGTFQDTRSITFPGRFYRATSQ